MTDQKPPRAAAKTGNASYLHHFAHDGKISDSELSFLKKLALRDYQVDEAELRILDQITVRLHRDRVSPNAWVEVQRFRQKYGLPPLPEAPGAE